MNFVILSPIGWDNSGGAHRPVQLAREFAARGHSVLYVEVEKSRAVPDLANPRVITFQDLGWDETQFLRAWYGLDYVAPPDAAERLAAYLPTPDEPGIVICSAPFRPALELLPALAQRGYALVYDVLDDISEMRTLGSFCYDDLAETYLANQSDLVVALSPPLREKFRWHKNVVLIRDGVDLAPFRINQPITPQASAAPPELDLAQGELTLGFWGTMWDYNLDLPLLQHVTRARPAWQWHFIGAYDLDPARPSVVRALDAPNVHFHSSVPRATLAQAARRFNVCLLPIPVTPFNLARDPLKVYEYLACYRPVVATNLTQLDDMPYVWLSRTPDEFLRNLELAARVTLEPAELDAYLADQTWTKRADAFMDALNTLPHKARTLPPPPQDAMPGAAQDVARWQNLTQHLERLVTDREQHIADLERALAGSGLAGKFERVFRKNLN